MAEKQSRLSLVKSFNESVAKIHKSLPQRLENLLIISCDEPIFISPEIADLLSQNTNKIKNLIKTKSDIMKSNNYMGVAYRNYNFTPPKGNLKDIKLVALNTASKISRIFYDYDYNYKNANKDHGLTHVIDHEIGHLIVREGWPSNSSPHIAECAADAYAAIRHIQRFGTNTDYFKAYNRSHMAVFDISSIHYTSAAIAKIEQLSKKQDLTKMPYVETATLAGSIAIKYNFDKQTRKRIRQAFFYLGEKYKEKIHRNDASCKTKDWEDLSNNNHIELIEDLIDIMLKNKDDHDVYRAGKQFLDRKIVQEAIKNAPFWKTKAVKKSLKEMAEFEKTSGIILNMAEAIDAKKHSNNAQNNLKSTPKYN